MQSKTFRARFAPLALAAVLLAGCNTHTDKIRDIVNNPSGFANHDVTVAGEVTKVYELPLGISNLAAYRINDGTGQIWVISHAGAPREGDKVGLKGGVDEAFRSSNTPFSILSGVGVVIQEKERQIK